MSFNTQPPEGGWIHAYRDYFGQTVSTHSRLKAAGCRFRFGKKGQKSFNTQPPEGGWGRSSGGGSSGKGFNTQPPEGGWFYLKPRQLLMPKGFNTQPPEGGWPFA